MNEMQPLPARRGAARRPPSRRFVLSHSHRHLRHSSRDDSNFNSITRNATKAAPFLTSLPALRLLLLLSSPSPSVAFAQQNLNLIMTLHVAVLTLTPSFVAYLPLNASSALDGKSRDFTLVFYLRVGTRSRKGFKF